MSPLSIGVAQESHVHDMQAESPPQTTPSSENSTLVFDIGCEHASIELHVLSALFHLQHSIIVAPLSTSSVGTGTDAVPTVRQQVRAGGIRADPKPTDRWFLRGMRSAGSCDYLQHDANRSVKCIVSGCAAVLTFADRWFLCGLWSAGSRNGLQHTPIGRQARCNKFSEL